MIRAFVAVELNEELRAAVSRLQSLIREEIGRELRRRAPGARIQWTRPESLHLTLKFLGDIAEEQLDKIQQAIAMAAEGHQSFAVTMKGIGVFPDLRAPRVIWVGLDGPDAQGSQPIKPAPLVDLAKSIDDALAALDFAPERRPFSPHLTLGRIKEHGREVGQALTATGLLMQHAPAGILPVRTVVLMRSELRPTGSLYTRLCEAPLRNPG